MYWNHIFLLLSKHSFCWLDISLKSCLNNFKWWRLLTDHDDVEGEEGAAILVQHRLLLHRPPWASLMADAWFPTPFSTAESSTTPALLFHTLHTQQIQNTIQIQKYTNTKQRAPPPPQFYSTSTAHTANNQTLHLCKYSRGANIVARKRNSQSTLWWASLDEKKRLVSY